MTTIQTIKRQMENRGITIRKMADELSVSYDSLRLILSGKRPLTDQLAKHIEFVLGLRKQQPFIYTVNLPDTTVQTWVPGFDKLTREEQLQAVHAICERNLQQLIELGEQALTDKERQATDYLTP